MDLSSFVPVFFPAALVPILREAGGQFFDWTGTDTIHGGNGISTNGRLKPAVQAVL